jgi:hypothetical protein
VFYTGNYPTRPELERTQGVATDQKPIRTLRELNERSAELRQSIAQELVSAQRDIEVGHHFPIEPDPVVEVEIVKAGRAGVAATIR